MPTVRRYVIVQAAALPGIFAAERPKEEPLGRSPKAAAATHWRAWTALRVTPCALGVPP